MLKKNLNLGRKMTDLWKPFILTWLLHLPMQGKQDVNKENIFYMDLIRTIEIVFEPVLLGLVIADK